MLPRARHTCVAIAVVHCDWISFSSGGTTPRFTSGTRTASAHRHIHLVLTILPLCSIFSHHLPGLYCQSSFITILPCLLLTTLFHHFSALPWHTSFITFLSCIPWANLLLPVSCLVLPSLFFKLFSYLLLTIFFSHLPVWYCSNFHVLHQLTTFLHNIPALQLY